MAFKTLFIGDVHGCATELEHLLMEVEPTRCILLGDIFRKGPSPLRVWELIQDWRLEAVLGNHDALLLQQSEHFPTTICDWIENLPIWIDGEYKSCQEVRRWRAVHAGINPNLMDSTTRSQAISLRRWPNDSKKENPFWWELYSGLRLVIYGHDAKRGVQDHRPHTLGLDSGCVYGNGLTGYILEEDRMVQVPSNEYVEV